MIKIAGIIMIALVATIMLKSINSSLYIFIPICCAIIVFGIIASDILDLTKVFNNLINEISFIRPYFSIVIKALIITLISQFVVSSCKDNGESALAFEADLAFKIIILGISFPLFEAFISIVDGLLK